MKNTDKGKKTPKALLAFSALFLGISPAAHSQEEQPAAKAGSAILRRDLVEQRLQQISRIFENKNQRPPTEAEKQELYKLIVDKETQKLVLLEAARTERLDRDTQFQKKKQEVENELMSSFFYQKKKTQWNEEIKAEELQKKCQEIAGRGKEIFLQMAAFKDEKTVQRIKSGLTYAGKGATFTALVNRLMQEEAAAKGTAHKEQNLDLVPQLEIALAEDMKRLLAGKKPGELIVLTPQQGNSDTYTLLYIKERKTPASDHPYIVQRARKELVSEKKKAFFAALYKNLQVQKFDMGGQAYSRENAAQNPPS